MIFKLSRTEIRPNLEVNFYQFTPEDNAIYASIPFFIKKTETLSEDNLKLLKSWEYEVGSDSSVLDQLYHNEDLTNLNLKVYEYCLKNNIIREELIGYFVSDGVEIEVTRFNEKP